MSLRISLSRALATPSLTVLAFAASPLLAQDPLLQFTGQVDFPTLSQSSLSWTLYGRAGDVYALLADTQAGSTNVLGGHFDLAFTPNLVAVAIGIVGQTGTYGFLPIPPGSLPTGIPIFCQVGELDLAQGFASTLTSNVACFAGHVGTGAVNLLFNAQSGIFDHSELHRLQALPAVRRTVRSIPAEGYPWPVTTPFSMFNPSGSRVQMALGAEDLGANGLPERLIAVRWRPLFGGVATETFPQFELLAGHTDVTPDYTHDDFTALPIHPDSGLDPTFATNPSGALTTLSSGAYTLQQQDLLPSGYLPFPTPQPFVYDGQRSLLLETRCAPTPALGSPVNHCLFAMLSFSSAKPFGTVLAAAGWHGQPSPMPPAGAAVGEGASILFDCELEFERTRSVATSLWGYGNNPSPDYLTPIVAAYTPPGTSLTVEYRGLDLAGNTTVWSSSPDIADGFVFLQARVTMEADYATGAVPWLQTLIVPVQ